VQRDEFVRAYLAADRPADGAKHGRKASFWGLV
jgi:hypothetical protein